MPVAFLHQTDLYKPPNDPDDHWDLACVYALAMMGRVDLRGIIIDHPPRTGWDPDLAAVAQMNRLSGLHVPCVVGSPMALRRRGDTQTDLSPYDTRAAAFLLDQLNASAGPVVINVGGSCRDVALAAARAPDLFRDKCGGVYVNAGYGARRWEESWEIEYNVSLDPLAYASALKLPCQVYWLPCFEDDGRGLIREYGTFWSFRQGEMLEDLSPEARRYFATMMSGSASGWLDGPSGASMENVLDSAKEVVRNMWCTAGLLHAGGLAARKGGSLLPADPEGAGGVFRFEPVSVVCDDFGRTTWTPAKGSGARRLFRITDRAAYGAAMAGALRTLLSELRVR